MIIEYLTEEIVNDLHDKILKQSGGKSGYKDINISATLMRIHNSIHYGTLAEENIFQIAAKYATVISQAHNFIDGNKRTAFLSMSVFLSMNDIYCELDQEEIVENLVKLANKEISEVECERWLKECVSNNQHE